MQPASLEKLTFVRSLANGEIPKCTRTSEQTTRAVGEPTLKPAAPSLEFGFARSLDGYSLPHGMIYQRTLTNRVSSNPRSRGFRWSERDHDLQDAGRLKHLGRSLRPRCFQPRWATRVRADPAGVDAGGNQSCHRKARSMAISSYSMLLG